MKVYAGRFSRALRASVRRLGASRAGVWAIKHFVSPLDRALYRLTGGRLTLSGGRLGQVLLLTTRGRKTGKERTTPLFYLRDGARLVVCNVNPGFERANPWMLNLRATPRARVQVGATVGEYGAREASAEEVERYWPRFVSMWPAYKAHYERSGRRALFVLDPQRRERTGWPANVGLNRRAK